MTVIVEPLKTKTRGGRGGRNSTGKLGGNDAHGGADCHHGQRGVISGLLRYSGLCLQMKATMTAATATPTAASAAPQEPKRARDGTMVRTIKVDFDQSWALSRLVLHRIDQQRWAYNMAVKEKLNDPRTTKYDLDGMLTKWRRGKEWMKGGVFVQRTGFRQGLDAVNKFMASNGKKRRNKFVWKLLATRDREMEARKAAKLACNGGGGDGGVQDVANGIDAGASLSSNKWSRKRNEWSHRDSLFSRNGEVKSLSVFEKPVYKGDNTVMLPSIGTVKVHGDVEGLDMRSFQLVETTKKTTRRTEDHNRTYRLHIQVGVKAPKPATSDVIRGVDMGIVHGATTVDLDTGRHAFHDIPKGCRRAKNDDISRMYSELSRKRGGRGNRRIRQDVKEGADGGSKSTDCGTSTNSGSNSNNTSGNNRNKARKPKSRSYRELHRRIQKKREKIANRQTNWERHASKKIADGAGTVVMEDLNLKNMTAKAKGRGSSAKTGLNREMAYSRPGTFQRLIRGACENAGVIVITVDPRGTSTTCHKCGHNDKESRISQGMFRCTNDKCYNDINADVNAAHNIAVMATAGAAGIVVPRRETPARDCSRAFRKQHARAKRGRDCKSARKRQKCSVYFCI